jgi:hypothetical protein
MVNGPVVAIIVVEHRPPLQVDPAPQAWAQAPQLLASLSSDVEHGIARSAGPFIFALDEQPSVRHRIHVGRSMRSPSRHGIVESAREPRRVDSEDRLLLGECMRTRMLAAAALLLSAGARADATYASAKEAAAAFSDAIAKPDPAKLLAFFPTNGAVTLFGKKLTRAQAEMELKKKNGVYRLLRWPGELEKDDPSAPPAGDPVEKKTKTGVVFFISPTSYGKIPECAVVEGPVKTWHLAACRLIDTGPP